MSDADKFDESLLQLLGLRSAAKGVSEKDVDDVVAWVGEVRGDEAAERLERVRHQLLGEGVDEREIEAILEKVRARASGGRWAEAMRETAPERRRFAPKKPVKIYDPKRAGYMRSTVEEGVAAELERVNAEARGTPFFGADERRGSASKREFLRQLRATHDKKRSDEREKEKK